jgi:Uma2 family endonuclease
MSMPAETGLKGFKYEDLASFPDDHLRREIIDGELIVTAAPVIRHQRAVIDICGALLEFARRHGGEVLPAPTDVYLDERNVVEPDVLFVRADHLERIEKKILRGAPDLVVEVSSPSTRRLELVRKRDLYSRFQVPEYWYIDLEAERVEVYRNRPSGDGSPQIFLANQTLQSQHLEGLAVPVAGLLGLRPNSGA